MIIYGLILLLVGILFLILSILLCLGKIELLHEYHRENIKDNDKKTFGLLTGLSLMISSFGFITSGLLSLVLGEKANPNFTTIFFCAHLFVSIVLLLIFIKKYNGKIIS